MINKVILVGNTGSDPEVRNFENGGKTARVNIATTEQIFNPTTSERRDHTEWHTLIFRNSLASIVEMYVRKGRQLYVEGKLRSREWTDEQGVKHRFFEIIVDTMKMLGNRQDNVQPLQPIETKQYEAAEPQGVIPQPSNKPVYSVGINQGFGTPSTGVVETNDVASVDNEDDLPF